MQTTEGSSMITSDDGRQFNTLVNNTDNSRIMYRKILYVDGHVGDTIAMVAAQQDTADQGGTSLCGDNQFYWNIVEFEQSGDEVAHALYDGGWKTMAQSYTLGKDRNSNGELYAYSIDQTKREDRLKCIALIFRWQNGDTSLGSGTQRISPTSITGNYPILCVATKPFNYTFKINGGNISGNTSDVAKNRFGISNATVPTEPTRNNYKFTGWKITSQGGKQKDKVYTTAQLTTMFTDTKYYSSLFEDATFEAQWEALGRPVITNMNASYGWTNKDVVLPPIATDTATGIKEFMLNYNGNDRLN
jgi:hypothetical protein